MEDNGCVCPMSELFSYAFLIPGFKNKFGSDGQEKFILDLTPSFFQSLPFMLMQSIIDLYKAFNVSTNVLLRILL